MKSQLEKCQQFAKLHRADGVFVIPNPWDIGSAKLLEGLGFPALATTSDGFAYARGRLDGSVTLEEKLSHCRELAAATSVPINVDFEDGFADDPKVVAANVLKVAATGVAGCSIEDYSRDAKTLYEFNLAVERVQAAAEAVGSLGMPFQLTARAENFLRGVQDIDDTVKRLNAYSRAGAHVLYAPALTTLAQLKLVTSAIDKPFNALGPFFHGVTVKDLGAAGAKRVSVGSALTWSAVGALIRSSKELLEQGKFDWTAGCASSADVNKLWIAQRA